ncbi:MAG: reverse transcriptase family protein [Aurantimonas endophytica]|uniref:reverse transcriptase family protein n=1 Tax=Aurantimonas endophytica TaxID=1522175 RepID=UPI0030015D04
MPPRSFYADPSLSHYQSIIDQFFPDISQEASAFSADRGLPFINSISHLSAYMGIEASLIRQILHKREYHYRHFDLLKKDGTKRSISSPRTYLKVIQWWMLDNVFQRVDLPESVHGFRRGRSYISNAEIHLGSNHLLSVDLEAYFPSILTDRVSNVFQKIGYGIEISSTLSQLVTFKGALPQGSPCSPYIANIVFYDADGEIKKICDENGYRYTRYADDITISSDQRIPKDFLATITKIIAVNGFSLNTNKTRFAGRGDRMEVTGLVINAVPSLPREWRYRAKAAFHQATREPEAFMERLHELQGLFGALLATDPNERSAITRKGRAALLAVRDQATKQRLSDSH